MGSSKRGAGRRTFEQIVRFFDLRLTGQSIDGLDLLDFAVGSDAEFGELARTRKYLTFE